MNKWIIVNPFTGEKIEENGLSAKEAKLKAQQFANTVNQSVVLIQPAEDNQIVYTDTFRPNEYGEFEIEDEGFYSRAYKGVSALSDQFEAIFRESVPLFYQALEVLLERGYKEKRLQPSNGGHMIQIKEVMVPLQFELKKAISFDDEYREYLIVFEGFEHHPLLRFYFLPKHELSQMIEYDKHQTLATGHMLFYSLYNPLTQPTGYFVDSDCMLRNYKDWESFLISLDGFFEDLELER